MAATNSNFVSCLLCGCRGMDPIFEVTGSELRKLFAVTGPIHSEAAFGAIKPDFLIQLFECPECGFQCFDPALAGTDQFYAEVEVGDYYQPYRPEFGVALKFARRRGLQTVLDVGCGDGAFLDAARKAGLTTFGMEFNQRAAAIAEAKGHAMIRKPLAEATPAEFGGGVDLVTLLQVVEHLPDPKGFLVEARALVRPGGFLIIAVPSRDGIYRLLPYDPAGMPPHHVSRWRKKDLAQLARRCGLEVVTIGADVLYGGGLETFWLLHNRLATAIGRRPYAGGSWLPKVVSFLYRKLGFRYFFPHWGASIYAILQRPSSAGTCQ